MRGRLGEPRHNKTLRVCLYATLHGYLYVGIYLTYAETAVLEKSVVPNQERQLYST